MESFQQSIDWFPMQLLKSLRMPRIDSPSLMLAASLIVLPLVYSVIQWLLSTRRPASYPPGPPTRLGYGNVHQIPKLFQYMQMHAWAKEYGPIMGLKLGTQNLIVLNDASVVYELLVKRANSFSERAGMYIAQNHILPEGADTYSLVMRNDYNQQIRSMTKHMLVGAGLSNLVPMQKARGTHLVFNLLQYGDQWEQHLKSWSLSTPSAMFSGVPLEDFLNAYGDRWMDDYYTSQLLFVPLLDPVDPAANVFPMLRWFPSIIASWKRKAPVARKAMLDAYNTLVVQAEQSLQRHGGTFSSLPLIPRLLRQAPDTFTSKKDGMNQTIFMGGMFDAATGSSMFAFHTVVLAMAAHPEVQRKAQTEVDTLFGNEALPDSIDLEKLPYINACITEAQRWRPLGAFSVGAFGLPRTAMCDEQILGYKIPKGSSVLLNQWTLAHDPECYDEPDGYSPDRYIRDPLGVKEGVSHSGRKPIYTFGAGRRECLGKEYFFQNIRIALSQILWAFDINPVEPLDTDAQTGFNPAIVMMPKPFKVNFVPRRSAEVLMNEKQKADVKLSELLG